MRPNVIKGRAWVILGPDSKPVHNIDTDMIYHNAHLAITDIKLMGQHCFGNLKGWEDFPKKAWAGDLVVVGKNFGAGSSRQQAVDCFASLGIGAIIAESVGAIYYRNAINSGFPILLFPWLCSGGEVKDGEDLEVDFATGKLTNLTSGKAISGGKPFSKVQMDIYQAGSLFAYGKQA
jgi:3-isopropylmalate/(R)-2-methylmalate dehydratase small subunit